MKREELDWLYRLRSEIYVYMPKEWLIPMNDALDMSIKTLENVASLGEDLRICRESIKDEKVFMGFNIAVVIFNKYFREK